MYYLFEIIGSAIGLVFLFSLAVFAYSIVRKWKTFFKIYWGVASTLLLHIMLFYLVIFGDHMQLPGILNKYSFGLLDLFTTLVPI